MELNTMEQSSASIQKKEVADEIKLYTIENTNGTKLIVSNYGAAVFSLFVKDRSGNDLADSVRRWVTDRFVISSFVFRRIAIGFPDRLKQIHFASFSRYRIKCVAPAVRSSEKDQLAAIHDAG